MQENMQVNEMKIINKNIKRYWGMNHEAAIELKIKDKPKKGEIYIDKSLKGRKRRQVIAHEKYESKLMSKGMKYKEAHKKSTKRERRIK
jgi:hypothetical protein